MAAWLVVLLAVVGQSTSSSSQPANSPSASSPSAETKAAREPAAIRREVSELLKADNSNPDDEVRAKQVRRMCEVYLEVVGDERFLTSPTFQQQKAKLYTRLLRIRDELKRRSHMENRGREADQAQRELAGSLAAHLQLASQTLGGPATVFEGASGGGAVADPDPLIDLITETINPSHWNVNGGPGSIKFYGPALALVVRASSEVQGRVGDVIGGLRE
jgi:hypothetical protein